MGLTKNVFIYRSLPGYKAQFVLNDISRLMGSNGRKKDLNRIMDVNDLPAKDADRNWILIQPINPLTDDEKHEFNIVDKENPLSTQKVPPQFHEYFKQNFRNQFFQTDVVVQKGVNELLFDRKVEVLEVENNFPDLFVMQQVCTVKSVIQSAIDAQTKQLESQTYKLKDAKEMVLNYQSDSTTDTACENAEEQRKDSFLV